MKCIVTGGAGFIGSNLVDRLVQDGNEVVVVSTMSLQHAMKISTGMTKQTTIGLTFVTTVISILCSRALIVYFILRLKLEFSQPSRTRSGLHKQTWLGHVTYFRPLGRTV